MSEEQTRSLWMADAEAIAAPPMEVDSSCDVLVVGGGIAGLSAAYEAARCGRQVMLIDRGPVGRGMTARTTAHLASESDDWNYELVKALGTDEARTNYESQVAAINRIETICSDEGIEADFRRLDAFMVPASLDHMSRLDDEYAACRDLGMAVEWAEETPLPLPPGSRALRFADQGRFHPLKYCAGLARAISNRGGRLHSNTAYARHDEDEGGVTVETAGGHRIRAERVMFATNSPVNATLAIHTKQVPMRTFALAAKVPVGSVPDALIWDTEEIYHYIRLQPGEDGDWLIVGGEDHRSGTADDGEERFRRLERWARDRFPAMGEVDYRWSGQVLEPVDYLPYSGRTPGSERTFLHSGDSGMGMTNAVAGALNFAALLRGEKAHFEQLFDPSRKPKSAGTLGEFVKGQGPVLSNLAEYVTPGEIDSTDELAVGEGAVIRRGASKIAAYRHPDGRIEERSAVCTHVGCIVQWNGTEKCWDCPCHGSQFAVDGRVLNGPAVRSLALVEAEAEAERA
jgi:glycine/D-amino acid oxidase-like deaminating enzyme/nitrite reductase/ring-hydroxylating ferredoxin subunit